MIANHKRGRKALLTYFLGVAGWLATTVALADEWRAFMSVESVSYSEPFSVYAAFNELNGSLDKGDEAFTHNQVEIGLERGPWSIALLDRYDYYLSFEPATAELVHLGENGLPVGANRDYPLALHANHIRAQGLKVGYRLQPVKSLVLGLDLTYLHGKALIQGIVRGDVATDDQQNYSGEALVDYRYSEDVLLHRPVSEPDGHGYSVDVDMRWQVNNDLALSVRTSDLFNAIYWRDAPFTRAQLTSSTVNLDADGFINTTPLLSGVEGNKDFKQVLAVRTFVGASYRVTDRVSVELQNMNEDSVNLVRLGFRVNSSREASWGLFYDATANAITLAAESDWLRFSVGSDSLDFKSAHYLQVAATANFRF